MKDIKQILRRKDRVWFEICEEDSRIFLEYAKLNGCKWINGDEIDVPKGIFLELLKSKSKGRFFHYIIRKKYKYGIIK